MMTDVITIIPALMVIPGIDYRNTVFIGIGRVLLTNECMLGPVSHHSYHTENEKRYNKNYQGRLPVYEAHSGAEEEKKQFATDIPIKQFISMPAMKIIWQFNNTQKKKGPEIFYKINKRVPLIRHRRTLISFQVIFRMVHSNMVQKISFR
jgi:hypothetical protein